MATDGALCTTVYLNDYSALRGVQFVFRIASFNSSEVVMWKAAVLGYLVLIVWYRTMYGGWHLASIWNPGRRLRVRISMRNLVGRVRCEDPKSRMWGCSLFIESAGTVVLVHFLS